MADHAAAPAYSPDTYNNYSQQQHQPMTQQGQDYIQHQPQGQQQQYHQQAPQQPMPTYNSYNASSPPAHDEKAQHQQTVHPVMSPPQQYASMSPQHSNVGAAGAGTTQQPNKGGSQYQTAVPLQGLGMAPAPVDCPSCHHRALTRIERHAGNTTHGWAFATCCLTGCLCFIPYLMDSLKDVDHHCGNCGTRLAKWHKSGNVEVFVHA